MRMTLREFFIHEGDFKPDAESHKSSGAGSGRSSTNVQINIDEEGVDEALPHAASARYGKGKGYGPGKFPEMRPWYIINVRSGDVLGKFDTRDEAEDAMARAGGYEGMGTLDVTQNPEGDHQPAHVHRFPDPADFDIDADPHEFQLPARHEGLDEEEGCMDERDIKSYEHPRTHLHKKFARMKGVKDPWALASKVAHEAGATESVMPEAEECMDEKHIGFGKLKGKLAHKKGVHDPAALAAHIGREKYGAAGMAKKSAAGRKHHEALQVEYEDPTSSKNIDSSRWSSPKSHKDGVPAEAPHDGPQSRSSKGWAKMRDDSVKYSSDSDLKSFFGGETHPEPVDEAGPESARSSGRSSAADDEEFEKLWSQMNEPKSGGAEAEPDWGSMDDEDFISKLAAADKVSARAPERASSGRGHESGLEDIDLTDRDDDGGRSSGRDPFWAGAEEADEDVMSWDELRAADPAAAADIEREYPDIADSQSAFFTKHGKDLVMRSGRGNRFKWDPAGMQWLEMDDGGTPAGEF